MRSVTPSGRFAGPAGWRGLPIVLTRLCEDRCFGLHSVLPQLDHTDTLCSSLPALCGTAGDHRRVSRCHPGADAPTDAGAAFSLE